MCIKTLVRLVTVPLAILALALTLALPAAAGGGDMPTGPDATLSPPTLTVDRNGQVTATTTLTCWGNTITPGDEAHVYASVGIGDGAAGGYAYVETTCTVEPQVLRITFTSQTGTAFHVGPVMGAFEFGAYNSQTAGFGYGEIDQVLLPSQTEK